MFNNKRSTNAKATFRNTVELAEAQTQTSHYTIAKY